jgi:flavin reductase (DIM6/NTAB) family NADH-FMN oxidoreductase RutF
MKKGNRFVTRNSLPCPVVLLSVGTQGNRDAMTAAAMFVSEDPDLIVVSVSKNSHCYELIEKMGEFVLNVAATDQVKLAKLLGATHGAQIDKFKEFKIGVKKAKSVRSPLIQSAFSHLECKVITSFPVGHYVQYLATVAAYKEDEKKAPLVWHGQRYFSLKKEVN